MASKIIFHAPHNPVALPNRELAWKIADLHYGGADGKQPHKNGTTQAEAHGKGGASKQSKSSSNATKAKLPKLDEWKKDGSYYEINSGDVRISIAKDNGWLEGEDKGKFTVTFEKLGGDVENIIKPYDLFENEEEAYDFVKTKYESAISRLENRTKKARKKKPKRYYVTQD